MSANANSTGSRSKDAALAIAARSLVAHGSEHATLEQVVSLRAFDHHRHGLFQYAAIRVGPERAADLLEQLPEFPDKDGSFDSATRAACDLYQRMRMLVARSTAEVLNAASSRLPAVQFWRSRHPDYDANLRQLRLLIPIETAEIAELHFARGLDVAEVSQVIGRDLPHVRQHCAQALSLATQVAGKRPRSHDRTPQGMLVEAFWLDPRVTPTPARKPHGVIVKPGDVIADRYEIDGLLGSGSFADVYRAHDRDVEGHVVALKITRAEHHDASSVQRGLRELQLIASVFHPSVVQLKDHGWHRGHLWFVMPLYRGETLSQRLKRGPLGREEAYAVFHPLAEALATMHRAGVLHQDIKPDNIFLADIDPSESATGAPRRVLPILLDLGVAAKDAEVVLAGTPAYLAPEVAARFAAMVDPAPVGPKADVFSLALTLRDALDPDAAFDAPITSVDAFVAQRAIHAPAPPQRAALRDLRKVFGRWLNTSPDLRPSATELCTELALLTLPKERAARRLATLRWAIPTAVALCSLFGFIVYSLSQEAALQRAQVALARSDANRESQRADSIHADLTEQQARRKELEMNIARLNEDYSESRLTREQLASHVAVVSQQAAALQERMERQEQHVQALQTQLSANAAEREQLTQSSLASQQSAQNAERQLDRARERLESERAEAAQRTRQLEARLASMEVALEHSRDQVVKLRQSRPPTAP